MIIQGANNPLTIKFDASVAALPALVVTLWSDKPGLSARPVKTWTLEDMTVSGDTAVCPVTEDETRQLPDGKVTIEAKGLDGEGATVFWDAAVVDVRGRRDKIITLTQGG